MLTLGKWTFIVSNSMQESIELLADFRSRADLVIMDKFRYMTNGKQMLLKNNVDFNQLAKHSNSKIVYHKKLTKQLLTKDVHEHIVVDMSNTIDATKSTTYKRSSTYAFRDLLKSIKMISLDIKTDEPIQIMIDPSYDLYDEFVKYLRGFGDSEIQNHIFTYVNRKKLDVFDLETKKLDTATISMVSSFRKKEDSEESKELEKQKKESEKKKDFVSQSGTDKEKIDAINAAVKLDYGRVSSVYNIRDFIKKDQLNGFTRMETDYLKNLPSNMESIVEAIQDFKGLNIKIHSVNHTPINNLRDRYTEFTVTVSHDTGYEKRYKLKFNIPTPVHGYLLLGGNSYKLIGQLFNKPILKIKNNTVQMISNFGMIRFKLRSSPITESFGNLELINSFTSKTGFGLDEEENMYRDDLSRRNIPGIRDFLDNFDSGLKGYLSYKSSRIFVGKYMLNIENDDYFTVKIQDEIREIKYSQLVSFLFSLMDEYTRENFKKSILVVGNKNNQTNISMSIVGVRKFTFAQILASKYGIQKVLDVTGVKYVHSVNKDPRADKSFKVGEKFVNLYSVTEMDKIVINSIAKHNVKKYPIADMNDLVPFQKTIIDAYSIGKLDNILNALDSFVDPKTKEWLDHEKMPSDPLPLFGKFCITKLIHDKVDNTNDMSNYKIRQSEIVNQLLHKQVMVALSAFRNNKIFGKKIDIDPNYTVKELQISGLLSYTKGINVVEEMQLSTRLTKSGTGSKKSEIMMINDRLPNPSYFGTISPTSTPEYGNVGVIHHTTMGAKVKDKFGYIDVQEESDDINPFDYLGSTEAMIPFLDRMNTTRAIMGNQQSGQIITPENPSSLLVGTGFEHVIEQLASERFIKTTKVAGSVTELTKDKIVVTDSDGVEHITLITDLISRTKRGVFVPIKYNAHVSLNQKVKVGTVLARHISFNDRGVFASNKNVWVALTDSNGEAFEDGWSVSHELPDMFKTSELKKIDIVVPYGASVEQNIIPFIDKVTEPGEVIFSFSSVKMSESFEKSFESSDVLTSGVKRDGNKFSYTSPGGKVSKVFVQIARKAGLPDKIANIRNVSSKVIFDKLKECKSNSITPDDLVNCTSNIDGIETASVDKFKYRGDWFEDAALITVYIEVPIVSGLGTKLTLTKSGGKGTIQYIHDKGQCMITTGKDGKNIQQKRIDLSGVPLGLFKRKNLNILFEMYTAKIIYYMNEQAQQFVNAGKIDSAKDIIMEVFTILDLYDDHPLLEGTKLFFKQEKSKILKEFKARPDSLNDPLFTMIQVPFKNPIQMEHLVAASKVLGIELDEHVIHRSISDDTVTESAVPVGIINIQMLEHFGAKQGTARGSLAGKKSSLTGTGVSGTKEGEGASQYGAYDRNSLMARDTIPLIKELTLFKSGNPKLNEQFKKKTIMSIAKGNGLTSQKDYDIDENDHKPMRLIKNIWFGIGRDFFDEYS